MIVSSSAVGEPVRDWPHYVSAKAAIEAFGRVAALQERGIRNVLARPPRLRTDLTNTALGAYGALEPEVVAASLVRRVLAPPALGTVEVLDGFDFGQVRTA